MGIEDGAVTAIGVTGRRVPAVGWSSTAPHPREVVVAPSFDDFFPHEYPRLVTLLTAVSGDRGVAEDIAQEAMLRAHVRWDRISGYDSPGAWVRRVALNLASHRRNRRRRERTALDRLARRRPLARREADAGLHADDFWAVVRSLPDRQAAALALHYLEDLPVAEVAETLGCAEGTAKVHLHRGRTALARLLDDPEDRS